MNHQVCKVCVSLFLILSILSCSKEGKQDEKNVVPEQKGGAKMVTIQITSPAFKDGELMPPKYTCDGEDISPPLEWSGVPENAKSIVIICDDPDAPMGTWVHWVIYDIPPSLRSLQEGVPTERTLQNGAKQGKNDFGNIGYGGPCPPSGTHRYFFKIYALDVQLNLPPGMTKKEIEKAMAGHVLASGQIIGKYKRTK